MPSRRFSAYYSKGPENAALAGLFARLRGSNLRRSFMRAEIFLGPGAGTSGELPVGIGVVGLSIGNDTVYI